MKNTKTKEVGLAKKYSKPVIIHNNAGVKKSWENATIRAARLTQHSVQVGKDFFSSCPKAFEALGLPGCKMIKFRKELKLEGKKTFTLGKNRFNFSIV
jgi:hypothetical protein